MLLSWWQGRNGYRPFKGPLDAPTLWIEIIAMVLLLLVYPVVSTIAFEPNHLPFFNK